MTIIVTTAAMVIASLVFLVIGIRTTFQLRRMLKERFPAVWAEISADPRVRGVEQAFAWSGRHRELADPDLSMLAKRYRLCAIGAAGCLLLAPFAWMAIEPFVGRVA